MPRQVVPDRQGQSEGQLVQAVGAGDVAQADSASSARPKRGLYRGPQSGRRALAQVKSARPAQVPGQLGVEVGAPKSVASRARCTNAPTRTPAGMPASGTGEAGRSARHRPRAAPAQAAPRPAASSVTSGSSARWPPAPRARPPSGRWGGAPPAAVQASVEAGGHQLPGVGGGCRAPGDGRRVAALDGDAARRLRGEGRERACASASVGVACPSGATAPSAARANSSRPSGEWRAS